MNLLYRVFVFVLFILALPLTICIGIVVAVGSGLPVFFSQKRIGYHNRVFTMYKFRTMRLGAEKAQMKLTRLNEANGPVFKIHNDPRFTRVGTFLAHTGLDELPQLWNVLRGEMALIGPRPLPVAEAKKLNAWQRKRHDIKPGIMSPWILNGYHRQTFDAWMKSDIAYVQRKSISYDCVLAGRTIALLWNLLVREIIHQ